MDCDEGGINSNKLWKLKKKLHKSFSEAPTSMRNSDAKLLTNKKNILDETVKHYRKVLGNRKINEGLESHQTEREDLAKAGIKSAKENKTPDWDMYDLDEALKGLRKNKSSDAHGYINELFRPEVIGTNLKMGLLQLMNNIKQQQIFPQQLEACNIASIFKNKGSKQDFDKYRGIFRVPIFRAILEKLIYNDEYATIDSNLTDANVGARKSRNIRDNLYVVNAILNSVKKGSEELVDLCTYDVEKCFDALWSYECINDLFEAGLRNDKLALLFEMNQIAQIAIKTSQGMTERVTIKKHHHARHSLGLIVLHYYHG